MPRRDPPTIVLAIDGLRASALGAYGQTAYETPALDALAARGLVYDWCYAPTPDPRDFYALVARALPPGTEVFTEDPAATAALGSAERKVVVLPTATAETLAESTAQTTTAAAWGALAEALAARGRRTGPAVVWAHFRGLYGPWDAPSESYADLLDEEDPPLDAGPLAPDLVFADPASDEACEARFAAGCRYAGQVVTLDGCLGAWLDAVGDLFPGDPPRVVLLGLRGFPLGEHGRVGGVERGLFSEQQHAPLVVCGPDPRDHFARESLPTTLDRAVIATLAGEPRTTDIALLRSDTARAAVTPDRMARRGVAPDAAIELYVKPDDRWEQNNIASLEEGTVATLAALVEPDSGVATGGPHG